MPRMSTLVRRRRSQARVEGPGLHKRSHNAAAAREEWDGLTDPVDKVGRGRAGDCSSCSVKRISVLSALNGLSLDNDKADHPRALI